MKSLEIVNESIEYIEFILKNDGGMDNEQKERFKISLKKSKQIKQDLEVLEILRKYFPKNCYPLICDRKELEKWNKAKQWLEVNENE